MLHEVLDHAIAHVVGAPNGVVSVRVISHAVTSVAARIQLRASARITTESINEGTER